MKLLGSEDGLVVGKDVGSVVGALLGELVGYVAETKTWRDIELLNVVSFLELGAVVGIVVPSKLIQIKHFVY